MNTKQKIEIYKELEDLAHEALKREGYEVVYLNPSWVYNQYSIVCRIKAKGDGLIGRRTIGGSGKSMNDCVHSLLQDCRTNVDISEVIA